jgi:hypothetical protein
VSEAQGARGCVEGGGGRGEDLYKDVGAMTGHRRSLQRGGPKCEVNLMANRVLIR